MKIITVINDLEIKYTIENISKPLNSFLANFWQEWLRKEQKQTNSRNEKRNITIK